MKPSARQLAERNRNQAARIERLLGERDSFKEDADACASQLLRISSELSALKDEVALTIVACRHPDSALSDARSVAIALQEALVARRIDIRVELARLEGADL